MRTLNSAKNLLSGFGVSLTLLVFGFVTRKVFVDEVGVDYLGLNGLLTNILGVMALLEGGFAASVIYNLYKPLAEDDRPSVIALMQLYKRVYHYIALAVFFCGLAIYPFLHFFIADFDDINDVAIIYSIFLFNSLVQYFSAYKWSIINASQQNFKLFKVNLIYQISLGIAKIAVLYLTQNYIAYLVVEAVLGLALNVAVIRKANKLFPYLQNAPDIPVSAQTKKNIVTNMKAIFLHSLGGYFMHSTDNIVMSAYIGVGIVGLYSNYALIISAIKNFMTQVFNSYSESIGNLLAAENSNHSFEIFNTIFFISFLIVSVPIVILSVTLHPFLSWWLGSQYFLGASITVIVLVNFYIDGMRNCTLTFKTKSGIFTQDRFTPLIQGVINLILSIIFVKIWGLFGVLLATAISMISISFWQWPRLIFKYTFHRSTASYYRKFFFYTMIMLLDIAISRLLCSLISTESLLLKVLLNALTAFSLTVALYFIFFSKTYEYKSVIEHVKMLKPRNP